MGRWYHSHLYISPASRVRCRHDHPWARRLDSRVDQGLEALATEWRGGPVLIPIRAVDDRTNFSLDQLRAVMERPSETPSATPDSADIPKGILLTRDLIFTSKVTGTAQNLGYSVLIAGDEASGAFAMIDRWQPRVLLLDLTAEDLTAPDSLQMYREHTGPGTTFLAFGPHVDTSSLTRARNAGCDLVMPRSEFPAHLPELIRRLFSGR